MFYAAYDASLSRYHDRRTVAMYMYNVHVGIVDVNVAFMCSVSFMNTASASIEY